MYRFGKPGSDTIAFIKFSGKRRPSRCVMPRFAEDNPQFGEICGRISVALCDGHKCDRPICELHRTKHASKANTDFCPEHKQLAQEQPA